MRGPPACAAAWGRDVVGVQFCGDIRKAGAGGAPGHNTGQDVVRAAAGAAEPDTLLASDGEGFAGADPGWQQQRDPATRR